MRRPRGRRQQRGGQADPGGDRDRQAAAEEATHGCLNEPLQLPLPRRGAANYASILPGRGRSGELKRCPHQAERGGRRRAGSRRLASGAGRSAEPAGWHTGPLPCIQQPPPDWGPLAASPGGRRAGGRGHICFTGHADTAGLLGKSQGSQMPREEEDGAAGRRVSPAPPGGLFLCPGLPPGTDDQPPNLKGTENKPGAGETPASGRACCSLPLSCR